MGYDKKHSVRRAAESYLLKEVTEMAKNSILTDNLEQCMLCGSYDEIERHHIMNGADRNKSTKYKLIAPLCVYCHRIGRHAVHQNRENSDRLKAKAQLAFEEHYPELSFLQIFGRNFKHLLEDEQ